VPDQQPDDGLTPCTGPNCTARVRWVLTLAGKRLPLDPKPHPDGTVIRVVLDDGSVRARVLDGDELPAQQTAWRAHWATCPDSQVFRARQAATTPRCALQECRQPLDPWLVEQGERYHVLCKPMPAPDEVRAAARRRGPDALPGMGA
jgi:hypothetical protein